MTDQPQQTFRYWIDIGQTAGQYTLHRRLVNKPEHFAVKEYTYIRNLGRVYSEAFERAEKWIDENHPETFGVVKDFAPEEGGELRNAGKYDDDVIWFGKWAGKSIDWLVENKPDYLRYIAENFDRNVGKPRVDSLLEKIDALELGESERARKMREANEAREKLEAAREAKLAKDPQFGEGRHTITGTVLHTKYETTCFGYTTQNVMKMLVEDDAGLRYWGTCPSALTTADDGMYMGHDIRGHRVQFDATVEQSRDDQYFGFIKRPTKASRI